MSEAPAGYLTVQDAAQTLQRSAEQVRRYLREGRLEGTRIGGQWFIREAAVRYRTKREEAPLHPPGEPPMNPPVKGNEDIAMRRAIMERIRIRRDRIRERWEREDVVVDAAALVRELREEH